MSVPASILIVPGAARVCQVAYTCGYLGVTGMLLGGQLLRTLSLRPGKPEGTRFSPGPIGQNPENLLRGAVPDRYSTGTIAAPNPIGPGRTTH